MGSCVYVVPSASVVVVGSSDEFWRMRIAAPLAVDGAVDRTRKVRREARSANRLLRTSMMIWCRERGCEEYEEILSLSSVKGAYKPGDGQSRIIN